MDEQHSSGGVSPLDYLRPVWRFRWIALVIVVLAGSLTYAYYERQAKTFESSTQLYVGQSDIDQLLSAAGGAAGTSQRDLANQARLVTTPEVAVAVIRRLRLSRSTDSVLSSIQVRPDAEADFLTLVTTGPTGRSAAALADAFAAEYLAIRRRNAQSQARTQAAQARQQLDRTPRSNRLGRETLRDRIATLDGAAADPPQVGSQLSAAVVPAEAVAPKPARNAIFAAAIALLLAVVLAYVFDRTDQRLRTVKDVEELLDLRILAGIPEVRAPVPSHGHRAEIVPDLREPIHSLRVNLELVRAQRRATVVMISSALPAEGKSTVLRNLALAYRDAGLRVAVVEGDMRRPTLAGLLDLPRTPGLADVLRGDATLTDVVHRVEAPPTSGGLPGREGSEGTLDVVVGGHGGDNAGLLLYPTALREHFGALQETHDVILCDAPPALIVADALILAQVADFVVLVVRAGSSTDGSSKRLLQTFESSPGADVAGAIVNSVDAHAGYGDYGGYYGSDPDAGDADGAARPTASSKT